MTSRSAALSAAPARMTMAKSAHARRGLRATAHSMPRPFFSTYDDSDDVDVPEAALGPDKTAASTPS